MRLSQHSSAGPAKMLHGPGGDRIARRPGDESFPQDIEFANVADGIGFLADCRRQGFNPYRTMVTSEVALGALELLEIDACDFDKTDRAILSAIIDKCDGTETPFSSAKSRTSRCRRLATRGVPRARAATSAAPAFLICFEQMSRTLDDLSQFAIIWPNPLSPMGLFQSQWYPLALLASMLSLLLRAVFSRGTVMIETRLGIIEHPALP